MPKSLCICYVWSYIASCFVVYAFVIYHLSVCCAIEVIHGHTMEGCPTHTKSLTWLFFCTISTVVNNGCSLCIITPYQQGVFFLLINEWPYQQWWLNIVIFFVWLCLFFFLLMSKAKVYYKQFFVWECFITL